MGRAAYDLNRFETKRTAPARVKVAKKRKKPKNSPVLRMISNLFMAVILVVLVSGVLYTQVTLTELERQIEEKTTELTEEEAMYAYLSFELESKTNLNTVEIRAKELGLEKVKSSQITYIRVEDGSEIEVKENIFSQFFKDAKKGFLSILDYLNP